MLSTPLRRQPAARVRRQLLPLIFAVIVLVPCALIVSRVAADTGTGSISMTTIDVAVPTEHFDTLSNTAGSTTNTALPTGWYITETGGGARDNEQYAVDTGGSTTGDIYSYGSAAATDRALGQLRSGTLIPLIGAKYTNNTGATITSLDVSYVGEEWRLGSVTRTSAPLIDQMNFEVSTNATDLSTGTYTNVAALNFVSPDNATVGAKNGNAAADRTALSTTINGLSIPNGASFFIRWTDIDANGADDGLAIDDFSITPHGAGGAATPTPTPSLSINDVSQAEGNAGTTNFNFTVSLSSPAQTGGVSFTVNTADGTTNPATAGSDYVAIVNGAGSIPEGSSSTQVTVTVNGDTTQEQNETFFVNISGVTGAGVTDGQGLGTITNDDVTLIPIHDIQGNGSTSPVAGQNITTRGIVTGIKAGSSGGFFIQEPDATVDADPNTSEGVFVFTGSSVPAAAVVGNNVQVSGTVQEFIPAADTHQHSETELSGTISASVLSTGNTIPGPHVITAAETQVNDLDNLERYEGMRVTVPSLTVVAPTQGTITEPSATVSSNGVFYGVVAGVARPFREAGVNVSDTLPGGSPANVPRFDENPERIRVDSDGLTGTTALNVSAGAVLTNVTGPLDYQFRTYTILPDTTLTATNGGATPAPTPTTTEFTVASFNMERFFDTVNDPNTSDAVLTQTALDKRLNKASLIIRNVQRYPDVIGVEEMENLSTLQMVAAKVNSDAQSIDGLPNPNYVAYLSEGNDIGGIDVGFLVKESRVTTVDVTQIELAGCNHITGAGCNTYTNPNTGNQELLNDRPPLVLRATIARPGGLGALPFTIIVNHLRSLSSIDDDVTPNGTGTEGSRVRAKRKAQAEFLANYIQSRQNADPNEKIITVGDMNAFRINDGYVDVIGTILGTPAPDDQTVVPGDGADLVNPNQTDLVDTLTADQRYSYSFDGNAQVLDHVIVNPNAQAILNRFAYAREDADQPVKDYEDGNIPDRISDHDQPIAYFSLTTPVTPGQVIISEFRFRGPGATPTVGRNNEFIEFYNNTNSTIVVSTTDGSAGWALVAADDGNARFIIPNGTVIPSHGHFLAVNTGGYSLNVSGDSLLLPGGLTPAGGYTGDITDGSGIALFNTANPANFTLANRLDAAGYAGNSSLYFEGTGFPTGGDETINYIDYSFVRNMMSGFPQDTGNNAADFLGVQTYDLGAGVATGQGAYLGAPGPENLTSPTLRLTSQIVPALINNSASSTASPNRVRNTDSYHDTMTPSGPTGTGSNYTLGTLSVQKRFINNTGANVTRLRFRVVDVTTLGTPYYIGTGTQADVRVLSSNGTVKATGGATVTVVHGLTLDAPPQTRGGGWNSTVSLDLSSLPGGGLAQGDSVDVQFLLGVAGSGTFRFFIVSEALN
ncbi:MAG: Calx-beta domain-containing protein [Pyrinomonadaceae bacterium]